MFGREAAIDDTCLSAGGGDGPTRTLTMVRDAQLVTTDIEAPIAPTSSMVFRIDRRK
jgi:hypothetical protein